MSLKHVTAAFVGTTIISAAAQAATTVAYWRFEDNYTNATTTRAEIPVGDNALLDSSGNGYHMRTFNASTAPEQVYGDVASAPFTNTRALDFSPATDNLNAEDIYTTASEIASYDLTSFTIEAFVKPQSMWGKGWGSFLGKDGKPVGSNPLAPFQLKRAEGGVSVNRFMVEWIDGSNASHLLTSSFTITDNQWYQIAFTVGGGEAKLWIKEAGDADYQLEAQKTGIATDGLINNTANWTIGRGFYNNEITDFTNAMIDEVRITDGVLENAQFLANVPEPTALGMLAAALPLVLRRRRVA